MPKVQRQTPSKRPAPKRRSEPTGGAWDRIVPLGEGDDDFVRITLYGKSGTGKTRTAATFPKPILWIVCSGSTRAGELKSLKGPQYRGKIDLVVIRSSEEVGELAERQRATSKYATVVMDHATGLQELVVKEVGGLEEIPIQMSWGIITQQQWMPVNAQVKERLKQLLDLPCNAVVIAQERTFKDDGDNPDSILTPYVASALTPGVVGWLHYASDYICQTMIRAKTDKQVTVVNGQKVTTEIRGKGKEYCLRTAPSDVYATKFRVPPGTKLPEFIVDPSYDKIVALISGGK